MIIQRKLEQKIQQYLAKQRKIIVIYGARQVGKTTVLHRVFDGMDGVQWYNGDDEVARRLFDEASVATLGPLVAGKRIVIIDEAQRIENIGLKLKILYDNFGDTVQIVATGSSSFDLANQINEPLTGRKWTFWLPAPMLNELIDSMGYVDEVGNLPNRLIYGSYPAAITAPGDAQEIVSGLASDNLYKDVLNLGDIIKTDKLEKILRALALQIGSQVSMNEIANLVGLDSKTVDKYISLLEQAFIIFRLPSYARNLRNELKSSQKIFFYDVGIRNAIINDFRPIDMRQDIGVLFENYIIAELVKRFSTDNIYFWRTKDQQEVDFVLEKDGALTAIEAKWNEAKARVAKLPNSFVDAYRPAHSFVVDRDNYARLLAGDELAYLD